MINEEELKELLIVLIDETYKNSSDKKRIWRGKIEDIFSEATGIEREYPEVLNLIKQQKKGSNIDNIVFDFLKKQIKEIKEGKRNELDIGDAFPIFFLTGKGDGFKFSKEVEDLLINLGDYKIEQAGRENDKISDVERMIKEIEAKTSERRFKKK